MEPKKQEILKQKHDLVSIFEEKNLLTEEVYDGLIKAKEFIASTYTDVPMYRPLPVKLYAVLSDDNFPTPEQKFWQCKIEAEVHANELVRDIHDMEISIVECKKLDIIAEKIQLAIDNSTSNSRHIDDTRLDLKMKNLDLRENRIILSRKRFEIKQMEKRIKFRIEEVTEWKSLSDQLLDNFESIDPTNYIVHYANKIKHGYKEKLKNKDMSNDEKKAVKEHLINIDRSLGLIPPKQSHEESH